MSCHRPGHYVARTGDMICEHIALGATLEEALEKVGYLAPSEKNFWKWIDQNEDFRAKYERARQMQADKHADQMLQMSRDVLRAPKAAAAYRVAIDILKWQAEVKNRSRYGSKGEQKAVTPLDPQKIRAEIKRLEKELGVIEKNADGTPKLRAVGE